MEAVAAAGEHDPHVVPPAPLGEGEDEPELPRRHKMRGLNVWSVEQICPPSIETAAEATTEEAGAALSDSERSDGSTVWTRTSSRRSSFASDVSDGSGGCEFEAAGVAEHNKSIKIVLRAKDAATAEQWLAAIRDAVEAAHASVRDASSQWLAHLNACVARGCAHRKFLCGVCRPHFRLMYGEDPESEAIRMGAERCMEAAAGGGGEGSRGAQLLLCHVVLPRNAGKLGLVGDGLVFEGGDMVAPTDALRGKVSTAS